MGSHDFYDIEVVCEEAGNDDGHSSFGRKFGYDNYATTSYLAHYHLWLAYLLHYYRSRSHDSRYTGDTVYKA
ncbi:unnamed protein product [marine sediment metagenome]|uniref:Uncharacterized protein n=1 Tax=marine sediment metagenome TaxID=412755 RepID=X1QNP6_9ZZZZ